ncbi:phage baseplate plug family protein [Acetobacter orleanensis]|uniref:Cyanophage baseplate Pam3 plug gp18 domain-containing protein n=1 Tax=Acetobacter orleanensis TaxID=104099 RepID=A0A4Y3TJU2_9PROT|nr:hypothetical protein [Acetobacter orleanensis]KXV63944.1 hypothetical protein AD949_06485 [Acetobacter orleanensis]PCD79718.1 hypothetical protein CO710_05805 [Acetobacter orleanensis]GAN69282.1 hypothetical protein Abol_030_047 [Acetobacter orleanensis JCM 7639]GBR28280.1 hypothetical protein AA0473_1697 [Acetobacter orleanensis NRIC 0473]GEB82192.1 hypothetical protein AOR01nite_06690 [Acetobacter orleanensis]
MSAALQQPSLPSSGVFFTQQSSTVFSSSLLAVPLSTVPAQTLKVSLSGALIQITLRQRSTGLYADFDAGGTRILSGVLCQDRTWLVRESALGLVGDFLFTDTQGQQDPDASGLGSRFLLLYRASALP